MPPRAAVQRPPARTTVINFFDEQALARRRALLPLAVCALYLALYAALPWLLWRNLAGTVIFALACTASVVACVLWFFDGHAVARLSGGRRLLWNTQDPAERRLANVAEEIAIAAGTAVPALYVIDGEARVNAYAFGRSQEDAVIVVTEGALRRLTRDELQAAMAHQFALATGGDLWLNGLLLGSAGGVIPFLSPAFLVGQFALRGRDGAEAADKQQAIFALVFLLAIVLLTIVLGMDSEMPFSIARGYDRAITLVWSTTFFGLLLFGPVMLAIAVRASRQRIHHADALAVQYTRHPEALGAAVLYASLKTAGAKEVMRGIRSGPAALIAFAPEDIGHEPGDWAHSHPRVEERLQKIFSGPMPEGLERTVLERFRAREAMVEPLADAARAARGIDTGALAFVAAGAAPLTPSAADDAVQSIGRASPQRLEMAHSFVASIPSALKQLLDAPGGAEAALLALLVQEESATRAAQLALLADPARRAQVEALLPVTARLVRPLPLTVAQLALARARSLPRPARAALRAQAHALAQADREVSLRETALLCLIEHRLAERPPLPPGLQVAELAAAGAEAQLVLSLLASAGGRPAASRATDLGAALGVLSLPAAQLAAEAVHDIDAISRALARLARLAPTAKERLVRAMLRLTFADMRTTADEVELMRTFCAALGVPVPPTLA